MDSTSIILIDKCLWKSFNIWLVIDSINGFFLNEGDSSIPVSLTFKAFVLILILLKASKIREIFHFVLFAFFYISVIYLNLAIINEEVATALLMIVKLSTTIAIFLYLKDYAKKKPLLFVAKARHVLIVNFVVFIANILLGLLGYGYNSYGEGDYASGSKGYFYAANELAGIIVYLFPIILYIIWGNYRRYYLFIYLFLVGLSLSIGTKSGIISVFFIGIFISYYYGAQKCRRWIFLFIIGILICSVLYLPSLFENDVFSLLVRLSSSYSQGGIEAIIFSGRDNFVEERTIDFFGRNFVSQILGIGGNRTVEMDPYDVMLNFGYLGVGLIYSAIFLLIVRSFKTIKVNSIAPLIFVSNCLVLFISTIAGHIVFSSMAGLFFAIVNAFGYIPSNKFFYWKESF